MKLRILIIAAAALAAHGPALAQPYKCTGPDGKVVFSDQRCETGPAAGAKAAPSAPAKGARTLSPEDQERIRALEAISASAKSNNEQKIAAQLEAGNIRRGMERHFTVADRERRDALTKELANPDAASRGEALQKLRGLYRD